MNSAQRRRFRRAQERSSRIHGADPVLIRNWTELAQVPESDTHRLEIDIKNGCGWIKRKDGKRWFGGYLSTHTFYGPSHHRSTLRLRECGFNITIDNWDKHQ